MYDIIFYKKAEKKLKQLTPLIKKRILNALERIKIRPHHFVRRIINSPYYRLRVGDYRVILDIKQSQLIILVVELGHRKNIYK
jgi:mRNA interferase RelE/StbE